MTPAALIKAESLAAYARASGSPLSEFALAITLGEAYELLDHLASGALGRCENQAVLEQDIAQAKVSKDPWQVLAQWKLYGLDIVRAADLH